MIEIVETRNNFEREPLKAPFGFKGKYTTGIWQPVVMLKSGKGNYGVGLGVQSPLWSDQNIFAEYGETGSNNLMMVITQYALKIIEGMTFKNPVELLEKILPQVYSYGKKVTENNNLRETFVLNALVPLDNAAWQLYSRENGIADFDNMLPDAIRNVMPCRHEKLAGIPLITYGVSKDDIISYVKEGSFFLKIKIGNDPERDGDPSKMLEWDKKRLQEIHEAVKNIKTPYSDNGCIPYYLDANGRYDCKERLMELVDHAESIGALDRIILLEEPFDEKNKVDVRDIPVRIAADESAHSDRDVVERINLGYGAIALKPIAKTLSMTLKVLEIACENNIPCFCADLTVNPVMVDWNKNVAARIKALPGMKIGALESNGHQNYLNWEAMKEYHSCKGAAWMETRDGIYYLDESFYKESGGILKDSKHYLSLCE